MRAISDAKRKYLNAPKYYSALPIAQAIKKLGCSESALRNWEREQGIHRITTYDIATQKKQKMLDERDTWTKDGKSLLTQRELKERYGLSIAVLGRTLRDEGIETLHKPTIPALSHKLDSDDLCRKAQTWTRPPGMDAHLEYLREQACTD